MNKNILAVGSLLGAVAIALGAFGAHGLKPIMSVESLQTFEIGVRYQMYHALFLFFIGGFAPLSQKVKAIILYLVVIGVLFFSGSVFLLSTNTLTAFDFKVIGFITPIGGLLLIVAWLLAMLNFLKIKSYKS